LQWTCQWGSGTARADRQGGVAPAALPELQEAAVAKINPIQAQKHLKGVNYPVTKEDLVKHAKDSGADKELCAHLEKMPGDRFETPADVSKAIGAAND
jgi:hypothetical protein